MSRPKRIYWHKETGTRIHYHNLPDNNIQFDAYCSPDSPPDVNPGCHARVYFNDEQLSFYISFPKSKLPEWESIMTSVRDLMTNWRQK